MSVMSIRIDDDKRKKLKIIASIEGKSMGGIVSDLIETYLTRNKEKLEVFAEDKDLTAWMKLAESSFSDWDNEEDEVYNDL